MPSASRGEKCLPVDTLDLAAVLHLLASSGQQLAPFWCGVTKSNEKVRDVFFVVDR